MVGREVFVCDRGLWQVGKVTHQDENTGACRVRLSRRETKDFPESAVELKPRKKDDEDEDKE